MSKQTHDFQGYWMRSHSETRWAGMMDALGIQWIYEPCVVKTRHGGYLPDFYLPGAGVYLEVKGPRPTDKEIDKGRDLAAATGNPVMFAWGDMAFSPDGVCGGRLGSISETGMKELSTFDLRAVVRFGLGERVFMRYLQAGIKKPHPGATDVRDLILPHLAGLIGRSASEGVAAAHHAELNNGRLNQSRAITLAEWSLCEYLRRPGTRKAVTC